MNRRSVLYCVLALQLVASGALAEATAKQIRSARTPQQFLDLGGHKATAAEFNSKVVGHQLSEKEWIWFIYPDGTHMSKATDGSWEDKGGKWKMKGDQYCRNTAEKPKFNCSDVYILGNSMRFSGDGGKLAGWTVTIK